MARIYILLLLVMIIWGFNLSALVVLVSAVDPVILTALRIFIAGIVVLIITRLMGIFRLPTKGEWKTIGIITIFNVALHHSLLAIGLTKTSGANASVIIGSLPILTVVLTAILLKQRLTRARLLGFILGFVGIILTSLAGADSLGSLSSGDLIVFLSIFSQAFSFILISKLNPAFDPRLLTGYMLIVGSGFIFITALVMNQNISQLSALFTWKTGSVFLFSAIGATALGHMVYNYAVRNIGPAEIATFANLSTVFALIGSAFFLKEEILINHYIGLVFIIIGVFFGTGAYEYLVRKRHKNQM